MTQEPCQTTGPIWSVEWLGKYEWSGDERGRDSIDRTKRVKRIFGGEWLAGPALPQTGTNARLKPLQPL